MTTTAPRPFLTARWRSLAMLNYPVDPGVLAPLVPAGTELDFWDGRTFVSMVGFLFLDTRVRGLAIPYHRNFEEVNLRFYVRRQGPEGWRRGVVFVKEIVPRWAIAATARLLYGEKYGAMPMRHTLTGDPARGGMEVMYGWRWRGRWNGLGGVVEGTAREAEPGSEEEFITEHYWGYSSLRGGGTVEYRVEHPRWRVWKLGRPVLDCDAATLYGQRFELPLSGEPSSAFLADGSEVTVYQGVRVVEPGRSTKEEVRRTSLTFAGSPVMVLDRPIWEFPAGSQRGQINNFKENAMKRKIQKRLALNKETLAELSAQNLGFAVGGARSATDEGGASACTDGCQFPSQDCTLLSKCCG